jgi:hypothetical protein
LDGTTTFLVEEVMWRVAEPIPRKKAAASQLRWRPQMKLRFQGQLKDADMAVKDGLGDFQHSWVGEKRCQLRAVGNRMLPLLRLCFLLRRRRPPA